MPPPSDSSLHGLVGQLLPQLIAEIGATQDEIRRASARLGRVPPALLQNGSKAALDGARASLDKASDQIVICLQKLHEQYPASSASG
jgi:hypothetical protein